MDEMPPFIDIEARKRQPTLWFEDGNVILTTNLSIFRVHRGLLSMNSPVFADMLTLPQPEASEDILEGLPMVEISDDDDSFTHLLHYFYVPRYYYRGSEASFDKISGLLRMSTKYQIDDLREEVINHLALAYPATLEKYKEAVDPNTKFPLFPPFPGQHFAVVALARQTDALILLPAALWRSSCESSQIIDDGVVGLNGTTHRLPPKDLASCLRIKLKAVKSYINAETSLPSLLKESDCDRIERRDAQARVFPCRGLAASSVCLHFSQDIVRDDLDVLKHMDAFDVWGALVCDACREVTGSTIHVLRTHWWNKIPEWLSLPPWKVE
ncbi:hypothetical protein BD410DRAFT_776947 [Rickenella mellea]|uniref:BTB domain-containing protein n=1 Tax=Rickenella mellea TaxID=50990 RepID=A0A4Y7PPD3_9AGAM|nr:hypothetical protein BD410DRAFT_776947 [Rickenella mellea]